MKRGKGNDFHLTEFQDSGCVGVTSPQTHRYYMMGCRTVNSDFHLKVITAENKGSGGEVRIFLKCKG